MTLNYVIPLPGVDEHGTPLSKMPNCPNCGEDELGLIEPNRGLCYRCQCVVLRTPTGESITATPAVCGHCPWQGTVGACEPNDDGELTCPQCGQIIVIRLQTPKEIDR